MNINPQRARALFLAALELSEPTARRELLDRECADDAALRQRVEALLGAHDAAGVNWCPGLSEFLRALALERLNRREEVQAALERGRQWCADQRVDGASPLHPHDRIHAVVLLREAEALLSR